MSDDISPIAPVNPRDRRSAERRLAERRASSSRALAAPEPQENAAEPPAGPAPGPSPAPAAEGGAAAFAAQLMGQSGQRRGLRGGPPVLDAARSTYLGRRYSGPDDRRPKPGGTEDTDI